PASDGRHFPGSVWGRVRERRQRVSFDGRAERGSMMEQRCRDTVVWDSEIGRRRHNTFLGYASQRVGHVWAVVWATGLVLLAIPTAIRGPLRPRTVRVRAAPWLGRNLRSRP